MEIRNRDWRRLVSTRWTLTAVVIVLTTTGVVVARGSLSNQTSVSTHDDSGTLLTLSKSNSQPPGFVQLGTVGGFVNLVANGTAVVVTPSNKLEAEGYFPKRTFISYQISAKEGTLYTVFLYTKYDGRSLLFGGYQAFTHANGTSSIATIVDFVNGYSYNLTEPLSSLSSVLSGGQVAVIFVPIESSSFQYVKVNAVQITWGLIPFGSSGFISEPPPSSGTDAAVTFMLALTVVVPSLVSVYLWKRIKGAWLSPRTVTILLVTAAAIRFALAPVTGFIDTDNFAATAGTYFGSGAFGIDWVSLPGFLYAELATYLPYAYLRGLGFVDWTVLAHSTFAVEAFFVKLPSILSDIGTGFLLAKFARRFRPDLERPVLLIYLFNPLTIYLSGVYGQFDSLFVFLLLAGAYSHFVIQKPLLTGFLFGATSLVNPVGFILWIALPLMDPGFRKAKSLLLTYSVGVFVFLAGLAPILSPSNPVIQTTLERSVSAYPGDNLVGTTFNFLALGQLHSSSIGYGLTFRFLLELAGYSVGYYFYPLGAAMAFLAFAALAFLMRNKSVGRSIRPTLVFMLGSVSLFEFFFPTIFLQFALWPFALILCLYAVSGERSYISIAFLTTILTGIFYVVFVDKVVERATGTGLELISNLKVANSMWAMIGLVYSTLMIYVAVLSISSIKEDRKPIS